MTAVSPPVLARRGVRVGPVGFLVRRRAVGALLGLGLLLAVLLGVSVLTGTLDLAPDRVWAALTGNGSRVEQLVVVDRRLSRALAAVLVGCALGCAGALTQSITRNPIASPDILGVTSGAALFAVLLATRPALRDAVPGLTARETVALGALVGGAATTAAILALSWRAGFDGLRLILVGLGMNALALAGVSFLLTRSDVYAATVAMQWLAGSLAPARMPDVVLLAPFLAAGAAVCLVLGKRLTALRMGREVSTLLGSAPARTEAVALLVAVALASAATALAGPIAFVAFVAPQAAMRLFGTAGPPTLAAGLLGGTLVLGADLAAQRLPVELPVGVVTAIIGAPFLLHLLLRHSRRESV